MVFFCDIYIKKLTIVVMFQEIKDVGIIILAMSVTAIGLFALSWIPYRIFQSIQLFYLEKFNIFNLLIFFISLLVGYFWCVLFFKLTYHCMLELAHCSATRGGAIFVLINIGFTLFIYECLLLMIKFFKRKIYETKPQI